MDDKPKMSGATDDGGIDDSLWADLGAEFGLDQDEKKDESAEDAESSTQIVETKDQYVLKQSETHGFAVEAVSRHLPSERAAEINTALREVEWKIDHETFDAIQRTTGTLTPAQQQIVTALEKRSINPMGMTPEEAKKILEYATDATPEIVKEKTEKIADLVTKIRNGARGDRRDWAFNSSYGVRMDILWDKFDAYEEDPEKYTQYGFDLLDQAVHNGSYDVLPSYDGTEVARISHDEVLDKTPEDFGIPFEEYGGIDGLEDLIADCYVEEDCVFAYGPYTFRDLKEISDFVDPTWASVTNPRMMKGRLDDQTLDNGNIQYGVVERGDVLTDLVREKISTEVVEERRVKAKDLLSMFASVGLDFVAIKDMSEQGNITEEQEAILRDIQSKLVDCAHYVNYACRFDRTENKKKYNAVEPHIAEYYNDVLALAESWDDKTVAKTEEDYGPVLTKVDDLLLKITALMDSYAAINPASTPFGKTPAFEAAGDSLKRYIELQKSDEAEDAPENQEN